MMPLFEGKIKKILYGSAAAIAIAACAAAFLIPSYREYAGLKQGIREGKLKLKKYRRLISQENILKLKASSVHSGIDLEGSNSGSLTVLLQELESAARNSGVKLTEIKPQANFGRGVTKDLRIELGLAGSLESCLKFIYDIDNSLLLLKIKKLSLDSKPNTDDLQAQIIISQPLALPQK